jgi:transposase
MLRDRGATITFQHDGAPSHSANATKHWFEHHNIPLLPHPADSPDINAIEGLWHILKNKIRRRPHIPTSLAELKQAAYEAWDEITFEEVNRHVDSMQRRVQAVLRARGGHTKY